MPNGPRFPYLLALLLTLACRTGDVKGGRAERATLPSITSSAATAPSLPSAAPSLSAPTPPASLPKLKPIAPKPFPEGATEADVCEAIDSNETDLWVRFGHLVPAYVTGAAYIFETGPESKDKLFRFIQRDYVYGYYSQQASCRGNLTLLYIRLMFDNSEYRGKPFGRVHLSQEIEKRFGIKTRESFQLTDDRARRALYCASEPNLCEQLLKLDRANKNEGMCAQALVVANVDDSQEESSLARCLLLPPERKACSYQGLTDSSARSRCGCQIRLDLGLTLDGQCERALGHLH
jgi:hypothetical protein